MRDKITVWVEQPKKNFLVNQAKNSEKSLAQFIVETDVTDFDLRQKRHNEMLYFCLKAALVWEFYLLKDPSIEGEKIMHHARKQALDIFQSVTKKGADISSDLPLFYSIYANTLFWSVARFSCKKYPPENVRQAVSSNIISFVEKRFDQSIRDYISRQEIYPLSLSLDKEKKQRWDIRCSDIWAEKIQMKAHEKGLNENEYVSNFVDSYCQHYAGDKLLELDATERNLFFLILAFAKSNEVTWAIENRNTIMLEAQELAYRFFADEKVDWLLLCSVYSWCLNRQAVKIRPIPELARTKCLEYVEQGVGRLNLEPRLHLVEQEESQDA